MPKNPNLGNRFTCFRCGTKFYDLNNDPSLCPDCGADQVDAPSLNPAKRLRSRSTAPRKDDEKKAAEEEGAGPGPRRKQRAKQEARSR